MTINLVPVMEAVSAVLLVVGLLHGVLLRDWRPLWEGFVTVVCMSAAWMLCT
jgi:hypothetical protein